MNDTNILLRSGYISVCTPMQQDMASHESIATVLMNLQYYGFSLSPETYRAVTHLSDNALAVWWAHAEKELKNVTGDDRNIDDFVVYKNFPAEVLNKTEAEYWIPQILMYWGFPNELFTEPPKPREGMHSSERKSITLMLAGDGTLQSILNSHLSAKAAWKKAEFEDVIHLSKSQYVDFSKIEFKENLVKLATHFIKEGVEIKVKTATDVLRLGAGLSDGDVSLRTKVKFKSFDRKTRRFLMNLLEKCGNLEEDVARRDGVWRKFLHNLHPGDFKKSHPRVLKVVDDLYNDRLVTFNSQIEGMIKTKNPEVLVLLSGRPGEFMRRLVHLVDVFGTKAVNAFVNVIPKLNLQQIVSLRRFLETANSRTFRVFPPKGNWARLQISEPRPILPVYVKDLSEALGKELAKRVPAVAVLDEEIENVKLPNGSDEGRYNRGTIFKIPEGVTFIRTASYWRHKTGNYNCWFDNGWNFFDSEWKPVGVCCWTDPKFESGSSVMAAFSGDPTNTKDVEGRAAQVIDLYLDNLEKAGVRYAVWNVLCYSNIQFSEAEEVYAALQWGKDARKGKIFEPSRAQLAFQLTGNYKTKYVVLIDLKTREMVYLDANFKAAVNTARSNGDKLKELLPAYMEYLHALPSVRDLFRESVDTEAKGVVLYTSKDYKLDAEQPAYIFQHEGDTDYKPIDLNAVLSG
jgi:hypothetical protein